MNAGELTCAAESLALFTLEQLLRATLNHPVFDGVDLDDLDGNLAQFIERTTPRLDANARSIVCPALAFDRVMKMAVARAQRRGEPAGMLDLLRAALGERHGFATAELRRRGVTNRFASVNLPLAGREPQSSGSINVHL